MTPEETIDKPEQQIIYRDAERDSRFGNYLLDRIGFYILVYLCFALVGAFSNVWDADNPLLLVLLLIVIYFSYYALTEYLFGKTPAKILTRTHVITLDGQRLSFPNAIGRSLCRLIPFDNFSFLFTKNGWHDDLSGTRVVYDK
jgi:uncharacterized RDD family membrane protein YckC